MGLPVLRLPQVAFDNVYKLLDVPDIILLSQCSKTMKNIVQSLETPRRCRKLRVGCMSGLMVVRMGVFDGICEFDNQFKWILETNAQFAQYPPPRKVYDLEIDGRNWKVNLRHSHDCWISVPEQGTWEEHLLTIVKMLRELFKLSIDSLDLEFDDDVASFQKLLVESEGFRSADSIGIIGRRFNSTEMDFMFDNLITDDLMMNGYGGEDYSYQKPLKFPKIYLAYATWISADMLFEMVKVHRYINFYGAKLITDKDLNQFNKWWLISDNNAIEMLQVCRSICSSIEDVDDLEGAPMDESVIMAGITAVRGTAKREEAALYSNWLDYKSGWDFRRRDGLLATVIVKDDEFAFTIWRDPNPNVEEVIDND